MNDNVRFSILETPLGNPSPPPPPASHFHDANFKVKEKFIWIADSCHINFELCIFLLSPCTWGKSERTTQTLNVFYCSRTGCFGKWKPTKSSRRPLGLNKKVWMYFLTILLKTTAASTWPWEKLNICFNVKESAYKVSDSQTVFFRYL